MFEFARRVDSHSIDQMCVDIEGYLPCYKHIEQFRLAEELFDMPMKCMIYTYKDKTQMVFL